MMHPYENAELSPKERAADLLGRMDIKEKMGLYAACWKNCVSKQGQRLHTRKAILLPGRIVPVLPGCT